MWLPVAAPYLTSIEHNSVENKKMFRGGDIGSHGFLSILFATGSEPLAFWEKQTRTGTIKRIVDESDKGKLQCIEILATNIASTFISSPTLGYSSLGIALPVLVLIIKNLKRFFCYQVQFLDDKNCRRRFRLTNVPGFNRRQATVCTFPLVLEDGWNELATNMADLCHRVYGTQYIETTRIEIGANCRLREVFFCESFDSMKSRTQKGSNKTLHMFSKPHLEHLNASFSQFPFTDANLAVMRSSSMEDDDMSTQNIIQEAKRVLVEYEDLANKVKKGVGIWHGRKPSASNGKKSDRAAKEPKYKDTDQNMNVSTSEEDWEKKAALEAEPGLSLGERLKRDMYFERPPERRDSSTTNNSRKSSKEHHRK